MMLLLDDTVEHLVTVMAFFRLLVFSHRLIAISRVITELAFLWIVLVVHVLSEVLSVSANFGTLAACLGAW